ncbi:hypothetical protein [Cohnella sp. AR92]|uniref:hypothetical protein n=1 Tax=Cohnella sp. AR92 TaxID=648716 RepID=UPI000F8CD62C|nr:hypothetical protein [Cohnella sp. AR92]RUS44903.1 hypothetical protein ELR57_21845 [Cohnella sp. AR92]
MRFAVVDAEGKVRVIFEKQIDAVATKTYLVGSSVRPILTIDEWLATSTDYRGFLQGFPSILYLDSESGGTVLGHVYLIPSWDSYQTWSSMRYIDLLEKEGFESWRGRIQCS